MTHDHEVRLQKSLDSIDNLRRRMLWTGWLVAALNVCAYLWLDHVARTTDSPKRIIMAAVVALTFMIATSTFAIVTFLLRLAKRILRAIDAAASMSPPPSPR